MVKNLLSLLSSRQSSILSGATVLMLTIIATKILGLVRLRLLSHAFSPPEIAIFMASFRIPDLMFQILIFGALSVAFIPVFSDYLHKRGEREAFDFAADVFNIFIVGFAILCALAFVFAPFLTAQVVPGFNPIQQRLTAHLTQIMLIGEILLAIGAFASALAQSFQRFLIPSLAGVFYNLGIILGIILLTPYFGIYGPALGVVIGASLHVLIQLPLVSTLGFKHKFNFDLKNPGVIEIFRLMGVRTIGIAAEQFNETIAIRLASLVTPASVTYLTYAQNLFTVPVGLFGATLAQAALPVLSKEQARNEPESFKQTLLTTMHQILFLTLPSAAILIVLRIPVVRLIFGASQFTWEATVLTGRTVAFMSIGLAAQAVVLLLVRAFYALKDTKTPVVVSVITVLVNVTLSVLLIQVWRLDVWSLGISYALATNLSIFLLVMFLDRRLGGFATDKLIMPAVKMLMAALMAALALYLPIKALDKLVFDTTKTVNLIILTGIAGIFGLAVYVLLVWVFKVKELETFWGLLRKIYRLQSDFKTKEIVKETTPV